MQRVEANAAEMQEIRSRALASKKLEAEAKARRVLLAQALRHAELHSKRMEDQGRAARREAVLEAQKEWEEEVRRRAAQEREERIRRAQDKAWRHVEDRQKVVKSKSDTTLARAEAIRNELSELRQQGVEAVHQARRLKTDNASNTVVLQEKLLANRRARAQDKVEVAQRKAAARQAQHEELVRIRWDIDRKRHRIRELLSAAGGRCHDDAVVFADVRQVSQEIDHLVESMSALAGERDGSVSPSGGGAAPKDGSKAKTDGSKAKTTPPRSQLTRQRLLEDFFVGSGRYSPPGRSTCGAA